MTKAEPTERIANALERIADSLGALETTAHQTSLALAWIAAREAAAEVYRTASHAASASYASDAMSQRSHRAQEVSASIDRGALESLVAMLYPHPATVADRAPTRKP